LLAVVREVLCEVRDDLQSMFLSSHKIQLQPMTRARIAVTARLLLAQVSAYHNLANAARVSLTHCFGRDSDKKIH
jgi:hypothetical protein